MAEEPDKERGGGLHRLQSLLRSGRSLVQRKGTEEVLVTGRVSEVGEKLGDEAKGPKRPRRCEAEVSDHLEAEAVDFIQFALRWVNCLLVRELPFCLAIRLWDTYLAEGSGFSEFLIYLCAAFLLSWRDRLGRLEFQELILFLQRLPTADWTEAQLERLLSEAFVLRASYSDAQSHLRST
ncbi:GTPase-activating protein gyp1 [Tetrabaena socialis]|uniref:GTPase-activating protein gyp1 n=1 Tax=Tetrabaena socialis TaxID=47790 RepID=A0A2J8ACZ9_9CHLO|nr:GTPase-activating protein gyp1 [Tetrabaena socialis]|eukprot:PNH10390.1 GTPase-activating protein gyp1 [Tetrabaena socialis]